MRSIKLSDKAYNRLEDRVWDAVTESPLEGEWWAGAYITSLGKLCVRIEISDGYRFVNKIKQKTLSKKQILAAFLSLESQTHCGDDHLVESPDSCTADTIIQQALFGELIYG